METRRAKQNWLSRCAVIIILVLSLNRKYTRPQHIFLISFVLVDKCSVRHLDNFEENIRSKAYLLHQNIFQYLLGPRGMTTVKRGTVVGPSGYPRYDFTRNIRPHIVFN